MFTIEAYVYLTVLSIVICSAVWDYLNTKNTLRLQASLLMLLVWACVMYSQKIGLDYTPVAKFAVIDTVTAITFGLIAKAYNKLWPWWIATFHAVSLAVHAGYLSSGEMYAREYYTILTVLSYLSLMWIVPWQKALQGMTSWLTKGAGHAPILPSFSRVFRSRVTVDKN